MQELRNDQSMWIRKAKTIECPSKTKNTKVGTQRFAKRSTNSKSTRASRGTKCKHTQPKSKAAKAQNKVKPKSPPKASDNLYKWVPKAELYLDGYGYAWIKKQ